MSHVEQYAPDIEKYRGKIIQVIGKPMRVIGTDKTMEFEVARRAPGTRLIIIKDEQILLTKEYREEIKDFDYRLPGGKVFDRLDDYLRHEKEDLLPYAMEGAIKECKEEAGLIVDQGNLTLLSISHAGATITWDLYYFLVHDFEISQSGQELELGEHIEVCWFPLKDLMPLCKEGKMREDRSVGVLFTYLLKEGKLSYKS